MRIASFNINNINKRLDNLISWLAEADPDVVCLQELKSETFPQSALGPAGARRLRLLAKLPVGQSRPGRLCATP